MHSERGVTLIELLVVLVIAAMALTVSVTGSLSWIHRQAALSAVYDVQSHLQLARVQAITRNRDCQFVIDESTGRIQLFDLSDPLDPGDDIELADLALPSTVSFSRPGGGPAVTLSPLTGTKYEATFVPEGSVSSSVGEIVLEGGEGYHRVTLYRAGGVRIERWNGSSWQTEL